MEKPPAPACAPSPEQTPCVIKGNINRKGECIYHLPGTRDYDRVRIDAASGEKLYCTEDEAKAAGCRAPKRQFVGFSAASREGDHRECPIWDKRSTSGLATVPI